MATILMTWNPAGWNTDQYDEWVALTRSGTVVDEPWSVANRRHNIDRGDRAFLLRQGDAGRGLLGIGVIQGPPYEAGHWSGDDRVTNYVDVTWSEFLPMSEAIGVPELEGVAPEFGWRTVLSSGRTVREPTATALEQLWTRHSRLGELPSPEEILEATVLVEGAWTWSLTARYERNPVARRLCLQYYGLSCIVCDFNFEHRYGELGKGYVHVHHVVPLAERGTDHVVDPVADLRPVCANCHYVLHRSGDPILTPGQLRQRLQS